MHRRLMLGDFPRNAINGERAKFSDDREAKEERKSPQKGRKQTPTNVTSVGRAHRILFTNGPRGADFSCRESEPRLSSIGRALLVRRPLRKGRFNAMRAASRFVVPLGAIAVGNALVTASTNVSSHMPRVFTFLSLSPIFDQSEPRDFNVVRPGTSSISGAASGNLPAVALIRAPPPLPPPCCGYGAALTIASGSKKLRSTAPILIYQHSFSGVLRLGR